MLAAASLRIDRRSVDLRPAQKAAASTMSSSMDGLTLDLLRHERRANIEQDIGILCHRIGNELLAADARGLRKSGGTLRSASGAGFSGALSVSICPVFQRFPGLPLSQSSNGVLDCGCCQTLCSCKCFLEEADIGGGSGFARRVREGHRPVA
jgi:hypothetical protein